MKIHKQTFSWTMVTDCKCGKCEAKHIFSLLKFTHLVGLTKPRQSIHQLDSNQQVPPQDLNYTKNPVLLVYFRGIYQLKKVLMSSSIQDMIKIQRYWGYICLKKHSSQAYNYRIDH